MCNTNTAEKDVSWPTKEDFVQFDEIIIKWRDLEKGIYRIGDYKETKNTYGDTVILKLGPPRLSDQLLEKDYNFVLHQGLAESTKTGREYFKFSLLSR